MKKFIKLCCVLFSLLATFACSQDGNQSYGGKSSEETVQLTTFLGGGLDDDGGGGTQTKITTTERKLITEGTVQFSVDDIDESRKNITQAVKNNKGYISSDQEYKSSGRVSNVVIIRVPAQNFDALLTKISEGVSKFDSKNIEVRDVTEEFLDIEVRLKTKKELEARYLELLKKANKVSEILEIEKEIGALRTEIESIEGRLNYLKNKIGFSTLTITFYEEIPNQTEFGNKFKNGFQNGWENLIWFFVGLVNIWPFLLIFGVLIFMLISWRRKRKNRDK
jgi:hypothetical protein